MICAGDVPGVDAGVVGGPDHAGPLRAPVQLVVTLSVGHQSALELRHLPSLALNQPEGRDFI